MQSNVLNDLAKAKRLWTEKRTSSVVRILGLRSSRLSGTKASALCGALPLRYSPLGDPEPPLGQSYDCHPCKKHYLLFSRVWSMTPVDVFQSRDAWHGVPRPVQFGFNCLSFYEPHVFSQTQSCVSWNLSEGRSGSWLELGQSGPNCLPLQSF